MMHYSSLAPVQNTKKLGARLGVGLEAAAHAGGGGDGARLLDAAQHHAKVGALHDDRHAERFDRFHHGVANLPRQSLLDLQPAGVEFGDAGQFGETEYFAVGNVANVDVSRERYHVVFAEGVNVNVAHHDHLVVVFRKDGAVGHVRGCHLVAVAHEEQGLGPAFGCFEETFAVGIFSDALENGFARGGHGGDFVVCLLLIVLLCFFVVAVIATLGCCRCHERCASSTR